MSILPFEDTKKEKLFLRSRLLNKEEEHIHPKGLLSNKGYIDGKGSFDTCKGNSHYFGMRAHIGVDPLHGFVHTVICTPANEAECKVAPQLLREDNKSVYGDAGHLE